MTARRGERGALLAGLATLVALLGIFSMIGYQEYAEILRRDREAEMIFRAQEIVRAIQRYRLDRGGAAPLKLEDLMEPGSRGQYFMRRQYEDPLVADGKWGLLHVGPNNQIVDPNAEDAQAQEQLGALAGERGLGGFNRGQRAGQGGGLDGLGQDQEQGRGQDGTGAGRPGTPPGGLGRPGLLRQGQGLGGRPSAFGGGEVSGLPIAGVKSLCKDKPFRLYNGLTEYSEWLFTYFDLENARLPGQQQGRPRGGQLPGGQGRPQESGFGRSMFDDRSDRPGRDGRNQRGDPGIGDPGRPDPGDGSAIDGDR